MNFLKTLLTAIGITVISSCHPRIYSFTTSQSSAGAQDSIQLAWRVKGRASLLVHDAVYPPEQTEALSPITIVIRQGATTDSFKLNPADTILLHLALRGNVSIRNSYQGEFGERIRNFRLVATKFGKDSVKDRETVYYPDSASDQIGFRVKVIGDSLVAEGVNNLLRWGDFFKIVTVANPADREILAIHAGKIAVLPPGDSQSPAFIGTPVQGFWSLRAVENAGEKQNPALIPRGFIINITIKHR